MAQKYVMWSFTEEYGSVSRAIQCYPPYYVEQRINTATGKVQMQGE